MKVKATPAITEFLKEVAGDDHLSQALRSTAHAWLDSPSLPWGVLRDLCAAVRNARRQAQPQGSSTCATPAESAACRSDGSNGGKSSGGGGGSSAAGPWLHLLCRGGGVDLPPPPARATSKSPELQAHLEKLRRKLEQDSYDRMVRDVTEKERQADEKAARGLHTFKQQMSFGLHVAVMMGTFYAFGHVLGLAVGPSGSRIYPLAIGLICMVGALVMETTLFVIRTNFEPPRVAHPPEQPKQHSGGSQQHVQHDHEQQQQQGQGQRHSGAQRQAGYDGLTKGGPASPQHPSGQGQQQRQRSQQGQRSQQEVGGGGADGTDGDAGGRTMRAEEVRKPEFRVFHTEQPGEAVVKSVAAKKDE